MSDITHLKAGLLADIEKAHTADAVEALRVGAMGKSGVVTGLLKTLGAMTPEERQTRGAAINATNSRARSASPRFRKPAEFMTRAFRECPAA